MEEVESKMEEMAVGFEFEDVRWIDLLTNP